MAPGAGNAAGDGACQEGGGAATGGDGRRRDEAGRGVMRSGAEWRDPARSGETGRNEGEDPAGQRRCEWAMLMTAIIAQMSSTMRMSGTPPGLWLTTTLVAPTPSPMDPRPRTIPLSPLPRDGAGGAATGRAGVGGTRPWY